MLVQRAEQMEQDDLWPREDSWEAYQDAMHHLFSLEQAGTLENDNYTDWNRKHLNAAEKALNYASGL